MSSLALRSVMAGYADQPPVVRGLDLDVASGELVALLGASGCGKTTTLRVIAGLHPLRAGDVCLDGVSLAGVAPEDRGTVMVFQQHLLFPFRTVLDNVMYGLKLRKLPKPERLERAGDALASVQLDGLGDRLPLELSGGQRQRAALARALVVDPTVLLLDEPLNSVDRELRGELLDTIKDVQATSGTTTIMVTHDQRDAAAVADRVAVLVDGSIRQVGPPAAVAAEPSDGDVARYFSGNAS